MSFDVCLGLEDFIGSQGSPVNPPLGSYLRDIIINNRRRIDTKVISVTQNSPVAVCFLVGGHFRSNKTKPGGSV